MSIDRAQLIREAQQTLRIIEEGGYALPERWIDLHPHLTALRASTRLFTPQELHALDAQFTAGDRPTRIGVTGDKTLHAARRLLDSDPAPLGALNFASSTEAGGGFLAGSAAQEESLARDTTLYASLRACPAFYAHHREGDRLASDHMIVSPEVAVLKDEGQFLPAPEHLTILTCAAPTLRHLEEAELRHWRPLAEEAVATRARLILTAFRALGLRRIVLGAWGCGAFRNDPRQVADAFGQALEGPHRGAFDEVVFAVFAMPHELENLRAFQQRFVG